MNRYVIWTVVGIGVGALGLPYGDTIWAYLVVTLLLPGSITVFGIFTMLTLLATVYINCRLAKLSEGDLHNFLPWVVNKCVAVAGVFSGIGTFAGVHWAIVQSGYGHGVFILTTIMAGCFAWIGYGLRELYKYMVEEKFRVGPTQ